mmetsp:Transcript_21359/g.68896  ORF Transcript_21359/g.68896 Transcript_21359/m.68896 type:complete len:211 (-) Transcript_21359:288-920(-)
MRKTTTSRMKAVLATSVNNAVARLRIVSATRSSCFIWPSSAEPSTCSVSRSHRPSLLISFLACASYAPKFSVSNSCTASATRKNSRPTATNVITRLSATASQRGQRAVRSWSITSVTPESLLTPLASTDAESATAIARAGPFTDTDAPAAVPFSQHPQQAPSGLVSKLTSGARRYTKNTATVKGTRMSCSHHRMKPTVATDRMRSGTEMR